ncbi:hypothetical protein BG011_005879 [Mortierella polycephala]|uniref:Kinase-like protein n=1 Tax=Mortierella polycephala TaxID=41804 RepID=A0A9P6PXK1_9FUNG|nr:hypothetical protein BG011_005879 [Mortierella polycephala]
MGAGCCKEEVIDFNAEIELSHFHLLRSVGKGAFGKVRVVQHKRTKEIYALKYINKAKCIRMRAVENIIQERRLLEEVESPLICNLRYAFQDDENLFMVLDLMLGGDLRFHLERAGPMREDVVRFYVAELILALDALHSRRIIHRDLKPDNVLLDEHGHAHLTDFNIAVYYNPSKPLMSIAGSMAYMAPEVLARKGYLESVDWWSLGVVMFELLFGKRPFRGKSNDLLTASILRDPLPFPENVHTMVSAPCLDVVSRLCERNISKRLGCTPDGLDAFKNHPWFQGMEWDKLVTKEAIPPFEPDSKRANFDATHELEELLMEDNPLKAKKRVQPTPETELSVEMQMMEDKFLVYDFTKMRRSHSLTRGRTIRPTIDPKLSSGTLDGAVTRTNSGRVETLHMKPPPKAHRPKSPSDEVGQDRYNPDDDQVSLTAPSYRNSPLSSPMLQDSSRQEPEKSGCYEMQQQQQQQQYRQPRQQPQPQQQPQGQTQRLDDMMQSEAIILPPSSLPRPLQPRDTATGLRLGSPQHYAHSSNPSSPAVSYATSTHSTVTSPATTYSSSSTIAVHKPGHQSMHSGNILFSNPDSGAYISSISPGVENNYNGATALPLMNSVVTPPARRPVRGREASGQSINSMPAAVSAASTSPLANSNPRGNISSNIQVPSPSPPPRNRPLDTGQQREQMRPMSAYVTNDDVPLRPPAGYRQPYNSSPIRVLGMEDGGMYRTGSSNGQYQQQHVVAGRTSSN